MWRSLRGINLVHNESYKRNFWVHTWTNKSWIHYPDQFNWTSNQLWFTKVNKTVHYMSLLYLYLEVKNKKHAKKVETTLWDTILLYSFLFCYTSASCLETDSFRHCYMYRNGSHFVAGVHFDIASIQKERTIRFIVKHCHGHLTFTILTVHSSLRWKSVNTHFQMNETGET